MAPTSFSGGNFGGGFGGQSVDQWRRQLMNNANPTRPGSAASMAGSGSGGGAPAMSDADRAREEMMGLAQGGIDRLQNDSTDTMIRDYLQQQMGGQTLDPSKTPFGSGAPQYSAQNMTGTGYDPTTGSASSWEAASAGDAPLIGGGGPWDATSRAAYMTDATDRAAGGEAARNQMIRDAILQSGGNASDPSLAASMAESMSQRNAATASAGNQLNMRATSDNFNAQRQADLANQGAQMNMGQFNAANRQQANASNAALQQQMGMANMGAQNQASQFGANATNQANASNQQAQNQAGMFNTGNNMNATMANFNAGNQALQYNQQQQSQAANQLGAYNNNRLGMLGNAEGNKINLLGQQRFEVPGGGGQPMMGMPSFQQFSTQATQRPVNTGGSMQNPSIAGGLTGSVWAGSGRPSTGSGMTTSSFGPTMTGPRPTSPMVGQAQPQQPVVGVPPMLARPPSGLAPQTMRPQSNNYPPTW